MLWPVHAGAGGGVAVLLSDSLESYQEPVTTFSEEVDLPVRQYDIKGDLNQLGKLQEQVFRNKPALILAVGAKAAYAAKLWTREQPEIPVVFIMVINWQRYKLLDGQTNITGIAMETGPGTQLANMAMFTPKARRIGVIYSPLFRQSFEQAQQAARLIGLEIVGTQIDNATEFQRAFKGLADKVDGFWMLNDPQVFTLDNVDWFKERCIRDHLVCIGEAEEMARTGLLLSIAPDHQNIGSQAASLVMNILQHHQRPQEIGVMDPISTHISVNVATAAKLGMNVKQLPLEMAFKVYEN
jgi:putative ABC transport system substrate-binding protein